jgi:hypothetical protein
MLPPALWRKHSSILNNTTDGRALRIFCPLPIDVLLEKRGTEIFPGEMKEDGCAFLMSRARMQNRHPLILLLRKYHRAKK